MAEQQIEVIKTNHITAHGSELIVKPGATLEEWRDVGLKLFQSEKNLQWYIGAWWNYGHKKWSREAEQFLGQVGIKAKTAKQYGWVCNAVNASNRLDGLGFRHHMLVAPYDDSKQKQYLAQAVDEKLSVAKLRKVIRMNENPPPLLPEGSYDVIYADPPWQYEFSVSDSRQIENQYPTMDVDAIRSLKVPSGENAVIYLWATSPKLQDALAVMGAWGFTYKTSLIWDKEVMGMGYWFRNQHELLLLGTKGKVVVPEQSERVSSVLREKRGEHSKKPSIVREWIKKWHPKANAIELFARERVPGWTPWGNEAA